MSPNRRAVKETTSWLPKISYASTSRARVIKAVQPLTIIHEPCRMKAHVRRQIEQLNIGIARATPPAQQLDLDAPGRVVDDGRQARASHIPDLNQRRTALESGAQRRNYAG
jgi:hypothetical protein